jgi:hypothetical protein
MDHPAPPLAFFGDLRFLPNDEEKAPQTSLS